MSEPTQDPAEMTDNQIVRQIHELGPRWASRISAEFGDISAKMATLLSAIEHAGKPSVGSKNHVEKVARIWVALGALAEEMCVVGEPFQTIPPELNDNAVFWRELEDELTEFVMESVAGRRSRARNYDNLRPERQALEIVLETMQGLVAYLERTDGFLAPATFRLNIPAEVQA